MTGDEPVQRETERAADQAARIGGESTRPADEDPAARPVREAGGGEAEGFEEAEALLVENAEHGDLGHSPRLDAYPPEAESDRSGAEYGEADRELVSEGSGAGEDGGTGGHR